MQDKSSYSIRRHLLVAMVVTMLLVSTISGIVSWFVTKQEIVEVYNANLIRVAKSIQAHHDTLTATALKEPALYGYSKGLITREEDFFVRITDRDGNILYISHPDIHLPATGHDGFNKVFYLNQKWRIYSIRSDRDIIDVAQSVKLRNGAVNEIVTNLILPQLLFIPVFLILLWIVVSKSLYPLELLSVSLEGKQDKLLEPVAIEKAPIEIKPLVNALNRLLDRLSNAVSGWKQFTSDAAHELRTPLTALKLQLTVLERADSESQKQQAIAELHDGVERSIALVQQLLVLARIDPEGSELTFADVSLAELAKEAIEEALPLAMQKNIDLGMEESTDAKVTGNKEILKILLRNLVDNALLYTPENGSVDLRILKEDHSLVLEVNDNGPGVPETEYERIFHRFYRGAGSKDVSGTGLGLAIVKQIVKRHAATITLAKGKSGRGLLVRVHFPLVTGK